MPRACGAPVAGGWHSIVREVVQAGPATSRARRRSRAPGERLDRFAGDDDGGRHRDAGQPLPGAEIAAQLDNVDVEGILAGMHRYATAPDGDGPAAQILASGISVPPALQAQQLRTATGGARRRFLLLLIGLLIAVLVGILVVQWVIRLGVLVVAVAIAPIAVALHGTPQTEPTAKLWWRSAARHSLQCAGRER
jgi:type IV secretory pathway TrbD component